ncbi:MAG TPA: hypothetical protein VN366_08855 [Feifaniaceae bacterium]|nr:hypothetical protein [Feifaniaceae bacterium]
MANRVPVPVSDDAVEAAKILSGLDSAVDFGGVYLTENATKVVVLLVKATEARKNEIRAMVKNPDILVFKAAKYSIKELQAVFDQIDSNGKFEWTTYGIDIMKGYVEVNVYYGGEAAAREHFKKFGDKVKVIGSDFVPKLDEYDAIKVTNEAWLKEVFPDAKEVTTTNTRFVFSGAPKVTKTRAVLNEPGESLTLYRFANRKDYEKCKAMIKGTTLVYGGKVVYVDTEFASTYFYNENSNMLALYCGSTQRIFGRLEDRNFFPAGGFGGFFARRNSAIYKNSTSRVQPDENTPDTPKALAKLSSAVVRGIVKSAPAGTKEGAYTLELRESIRGKLTGTITVTAMPGVMEKGRSYLVFLKEQTSGGKKELVLTDNAYFSVFELNDKGYVLPIREYGMTKPVTQTAFMKGL